MVPKMELVKVQGDINRRRRRKWHPKIVMESERNIDNTCEIVEDLVAAFSKVYHSH